MVIIGIINGVVDICVSINLDQWPTVFEMYPQHMLLEQVGSENIGWTYDGTTFMAPQG